MSARSSPLMQVPTTHRLYTAYVSGVDCLVRSHVRVVCLPFGQVLTRVAGRMHDVSLIEVGGEIVDVLETKNMSQLVREQHCACTGGNGEKTSADAACVPTRRRAVDQVDEVNVNSARPCANIALDRGHIASACPTDECIPSGRLGIGRGIDHFVRGETHAE